MNSLYRSSAASILVFCGLVLSGCRPHREMGLSTSGVSWMKVVENPTPGIHEGSTSVLTLKNGSSTKATVVVWADVSGGSTSGSSRGGVSIVEGTLQAKSGRSLTYRIEMKDEGNALLTAEGVNCPCKDGSLFLLSTQSDTPVWKQLQIKELKLPSDATEIVEFAMKEPDIVQFFEEAKRKSGKEQP